MDKYSMRSYINIIEKYQWDAVETMDDVPVDDKFVYKSNYNELQKRKSDIGPHEYKTMNLMLAGKKPAAMVDTHDFEEYWKENADDNGWKYRKIADCNVPDGHYAVSLPDQAWRIGQLDKIYLNIINTGKMTQIDHAKIGLLLGYSRNQVRAFLKKIST